MTLACLTVMAGLSLSGCVVAAVGAAGAAGAGSVAYVEGKLTTTVGKPYDAVAGAANRAVADLQFAKVGEARDAVSDRIDARTAQDTKVTVLVSRVGDNLTRIEIRVGTFGDKELSRHILDRINAVD